MKISIYFFITFLLISNSIFAQIEIDKRTYLYGNIQNSVYGNTLIYDAINGRSGDVINSFEKEGIKAISGQELFYPQRKDGFYASRINLDIVKTLLNKNKIETIILIKKNNNSEYSESNFNTFFNSWFEIYENRANSKKIIKPFELLFEFYNKTNNFNKPVSVIKVKIKRNVLKLINSQGKPYYMVDSKKRKKDYLKCIDRVINIMKEEKAF